MNRLQFVTTAMLVIGCAAIAHAQNATVNISVTNAPKAISPDLFGIFFEDLNYAADGGLYGELLSNRSFAYQATEQNAWNSLTNWELVTRGNGKGRLYVDAALAIHPNNPTYAVLECETPGDGVGMSNPGFDGVLVKAGEAYDFSVFARQLFMDKKWGDNNRIEGKPMPIIVRLESAKGQSLGEASLQIVGGEWKLFTATITATGTDPNAKFVLLAKAQGGIALDEVSLFPARTFHNRKNGLRAELAQTIADLQPKFVRFPGGCLTHGNGIGNFYRWKNTIGPIEQRKGQYNIWGYHQSVGLGYFEYFQFCEDIGAKQLPIIAAAVSCQNSGQMPGHGQQCLPMEEMPGYIADIMDLIEWANGPADSTWGSKRATAGHPEPFHLQYIGIGNEDQITPGFEERFRMIYAAVHEKHPEITIVGTVGPFPDGADFEKGWKFAGELAVPLVDEHYYRKPEWFWDHLNRYDSYDRSKPHVYVGEYSAHEVDRRNTLRSAIAEAALMTSLERNGDVVQLASYAPLLCNHHHMQWKTDMIYFDNTTITLTVNYFVQQAFSLNAGDASLPLKIDSASDAVAGSCVRDGKTGDAILKLVSRSDSPMKLHLDLSPLNIVKQTANCITLTGDPNADNVFGKSPGVAPVTKQLDIEPTFDYEIPAWSLTILRLKSGK